MASSLAGAPEQLAQHAHRSPFSEQLTGTESPRFRLPHVLLGLYLVLKPFYLLPSGLPQLADAFLVSLFFLAIISPTRLRLHTAISRTLVPLFGFVAYALFVTTLWGLHIESVAILRHPLYYTFNLATMTLICARGAKSVAPTLRTLYWSALVSLALTTVLSVLVHSPTWRTQLFFNNPNQLGYYAVLYGSVQMITAPYIRALRGGQTSTRHQWLVPVATTMGLVMSAYIAALSLSTAAMLSVSLLLIVVISGGIGRVVIAAFLVALALLMFAPASVLEQPLRRIHQAEAAPDSTLEARGYDRLVAHPEFLILGAAEGEFDRFDGRTTETHSTWATIALAYGIPGSLLFAAFLWRLWRLSGTREMLLLVPAAFYGLTHQGLRFTPLWITLSAVVVASAVDQPGKEPHLRPGRGPRQT